MISYQIKKSEHYKSRVLIIYTGGTLGMQFNEDGALKPIDFGLIMEKIPELSTLACNIDILAFDVPIDSSNIQQEHWVAIAKSISDNYANYDGFVILHGTDTMAYTASALSFMLRNLNKAVVLTGAQLPVGIPRSDARENILSSIEISIAKNNDIPVFSEVLICFNSEVIRGNRGKKVESSLFDAFHSENYPVLAQIGVSIEYNTPYIKEYKPNLELEFLDKLSTEIGILKLQPAVNERMLKHFFAQENLKAVVLETYGAGNAPNYKWFVNQIEKAISKGIIIYNVSQCIGGTVKQGIYESGKHLEEAGVISGYDITTEAAIAKLMHLLGNYEDTNFIKEQLLLPISGEITI